jgi:hypothetical protein
MSGFSYGEFTTRNLGFVSEAEQTRLRSARVFVCGTGGMGGAAIMSLIRAGVGKLILADIDEFEVSNLNRQLFATLKTVGMDKAKATHAQCLEINPEAEIEVLGADWPDHVARCVETSDVVINGTDDLGASLLLYRTAKAKGRAIVDAYASPLPSVYTTQPGDPMPEERMPFPTQSAAYDALNQGMRDASAIAEAEYVMTHSSSRHHVDLGLAGEVVAGNRSRMSFAPMVIMAGTLMAGEALNAVLHRPHGADYRGWFMNPHSGKVEKPLPGFVAALMAPIVRFQIKKLLPS